MWSDNETDTDLLQFKYLASTAAGIIRNPTLLPTTIGVFGDWGSGKSSLLKMIRGEIEGDEGLLCLNFSGWLFEGYEDAKTALMGSILDAVQEEIKNSRTGTGKARDLAASLMRRVNWLQLTALGTRYAVPAVLGHPHLTAAIAGVDIAKNLYAAATSDDKDKRLNVEDIEHLRKEAPDGEDNARRSIRDFHRDFAELLEAAEIRTLVVFIDDLDRCLPDTIIETLEAIKLFLFVPGTAFVLGADERLVQYAVRQRFPELPGTEVEVGRDYLEKLVQIPLRIPPLSGAELHSYMNLLFAQLRTSKEDYGKICAHISTFHPTNVSELSFDIDRLRALIADEAKRTEIELDLDFTAQIAPVLLPGLGGNPRRTKRFLNTLLLRLSLGDARGLSLQRRILAKLMLLEYIRPEFFSQLASVQAAESGRPQELARLETSFRADSDDPSSAVGQSGAAGAKSPYTPEAATSESGGDRNPVTSTWLADSWMKAWLESEPALGGTDLRPYFYIAHDSIGALGGSQLRLSPAATEVLNRLLDPQPATRDIGFARSANLSAPDASAVFVALVNRLREAESDESRERYTDTLLKLAGARQELLPQLVAALGRMPVSKVTLALPTKLIATTTHTTSEQAAKELLTRWSTTGNNAIKAAANQALRRTPRSVSGG